MQKTKHWLMTIVALLCSLTVNAEKVKVGNIWYNLIPKGKSAEVTSVPSGATKYTGNIVIPSTITYEGEVYNVTSIGEQAFYYCGIRNITIPESVTSIGKQAFYQTSIYTINLPNNLISIGSEAFLGCDNLTSISIPKGITIIEDGTFESCIGLTSITIPEGVTSIGYRAFYYCWKMTSIDIPESVKSIGASAFYECTHLTSIALPSGLASIEYNTFCRCIGLTSFTIPDNVTYISSNAFEDCWALTSVVIPNSVTSIGDEAFYNCKNLAEIRLSKKLRNIGSETFANCPELLGVYCYAETVPTVKSNAFSGSFPEYATLFIPTNTMEDYKNTFPWSSFGSIKPITMTPISGITLNLRSTIMVEGATLMLIANISPSYATNPSLTWSSSSPDVAAVVDGEITALSLGTSVITVTANDGSGVSASCLVTVEEANFVEIEIGQYGSATYCSEFALDFSQVKGLTAYTATGYSIGTELVTLVRAKTTQSGIGLFIKGEPGTYEVPIISSSLDNSLNMLVGTLESTPVNGTSDDGQYYNYRYTIHDGDAEPMFYRVDDGYTLGAGKAYLQIPVAWMPAEAKAIAMRFDDGGTTDIEDELTDNGQQSTVVFDLMGRKVTHPQKGVVYIVNGKKVVIK